MGEWKEYKLGEIAEITSSKRVFYSEYVSEGIPFYRSKEIIDLYNNRNIATELFISENRYNDIKLKYGVPQKDDILLTSVGSLGIPYLVKNTDKFYFKDGNLTWIRNINKNIILPQYLILWICSNIGKQKLDEVTIGSTQPALTISGLKTIGIILPSIEEQKRIASILSSLDDKIDLLQRENKTLEAMAETLFRKWFIEDAENSVKQGYLGDYILDTIGGEWGKEVSQDDFVKPVKCIRGTDIAALNTGIPSKTPLRFIKKSKYEKIKPLDGDIIIEISGGTENQSTGRSSYINKDVCGLFDYPIIFSNFCRLLRVEKKYSYFVYCYLQYLYSQDEFFNIENGSSGIKNLDYKTLLYSNQYQMPNNKNFAANFSEIVTPYFTKIDKNKLQICNLMKMRETLLPRLMLNCKK